ncbi:MAG: aldo/keto reductase [Bacillota bacterium]|jgi:predicted aldo/keto reductase-like oxidoreductase
MRKNRLGRTDMQVTTLGFGGIPIQTVSRGQAVETVRYAFMQGINFFDTAQAYTTSESIIGEALQDVREQVYIATKSGGRDVDTVRQHLTDSLANLRTDYIDLYQLHNVVGDEALDKLLAPGGVLDFVKEQQRAGKIKHIGITSHRLETAIRAIKTGEFSTVQFPFNYIEDGAAKELFPLARQMDIGIIVMKPIAGGAMTHPAASIKWILDQKVNVVIPGMESTHLVDKNIAAAAAGAPTEEELLSLQQLKDELGPVFCRRCAYCVPCPQGIPVNFLASAELFFNRSGWHKLDEGHVQAFLKGLDCAGCRLCESRCPYNLPLTKIVPETSAKMLEKAKALGKY